MGSKQIKGLVYVADDGTRYDLTDRVAGFPGVPEPDSAILLALLEWAAVKLRRQLTLNGIAVAFDVPPELLQARPTTTPAGNHWSDWQGQPASGPLGSRGPGDPEADRAQRVEEGTDVPGIVRAAIDSGYAEQVVQELRDEVSLPHREREPAPEAIAQVPIDVLDRALEGLTGRRIVDVELPASAPEPVAPEHLPALERLRRQAATRAQAKQPQEAPDTGPGEVLLATDPATDTATMYRVRDGVAHEVGTVAWDDGSEVGAEFDSREPLMPPDPELAQRTRRAFPDDEIPF